jgi:hypothetical protein
MRNVTAASVLAEIKTKNLLNTSLKQYHYTSLFHWKNVEEKRALGRHWEVCLQDGQHKSEVP